MVSNPESTKARPLPRAKNGRFVKGGEMKKRKLAAERVPTMNAIKALRRVEVKQKSEPLLNESGRRIVDLGLLSREMWCTLCEIPLSFSWMEKEVARGLASVFYIRCARCLDLKTVHTSATVKEKDICGNPLYAVNFKAASGCLDSGIGHEALNKFLSAMNMPIMHRGTMVRAQAKVGEPYESVASASCKKAILEEKAVTLAQAQAASSDDGTPRVIDLDEVITEVGKEPEVTSIVVEYDFGWDKRGSGFAYNSKSGRGVVIGTKTKKVLGYKVMSSACASCDRGHDPEDHDCRKNHDGSAKAMEPHAAVDLMVRSDDFAAAGVQIGVLIEDEDASTYSSVKQASSYPIQKWLDLNHVKKKFNNKLYLAAKKHKVLTVKGIKYLKRCFAFALGQSKGDSGATRRALRNITCHVFGEHENCDGEWCLARTNPEHVHRALPDGKPFSCPRFRAELESIIDIYVAKADMISPGGSSQNCESFNHMVVSRAPKSRFYGSTPALSFRAAAAVCQKNIGSTFILDVNKTAGLSPSGVTAREDGGVEEKEGSQTEHP